MRKRTGAEEGSREPMSRLNWRSNSANWPTKFMFGEIVGLLDFTYLKENTTILIISPKILLFSTELNSLQSISRRKDLWIVKKVGKVTVVYDGGVENDDVAMKTKKRRMLLLVVQTQKAGCAKLTAKMGKMRIAEGRTVYT